MLQVQCPDGSHCPENSRCCAHRPIGSFACCAYGRSATWCSDLLTCCPPEYICMVPKLCVALTDSSVLQVQASLLVNSTDKRCRDGTADMDSKVSKIIPSQHVGNSVEEKWFHRHLWGRFLAWWKISMSGWNKHLRTIFWNIWLLSPCQRVWKVLARELVFSWLWKTVFSLPVTESIIFIRSNTQIDSCIDACITPISWLLCFWCLLDYSLMPFFLSYP